MLELKKLVIDTKSAWIDFPGCKGFKVEVAVLSRQELINLRKDCTDKRVDRKTRVVMEDLDEDKFVSLFTEKTVKNWKGLKLKYLETLILVDITKKDPEEELEYSKDNAEVLVTSSTEFDTWLNEVVFDLDNFRSKPKGGSVVTAG